METFPALAPKGLAKLALPLVGVAVIVQAKS